jgi:hypothetical protein
VFKEIEETDEEATYLGLSLCGAAIGGKVYVKQHNVATIATICTNITSTSRRQGDVSAHMALAANVYPLSAGASNKLSTNPSNTPNFRIDGINPQNHG